MKIPTGIRPGIVSFILAVTSAFAAYSADVLKAQEASPSAFAFENVTVVPMEGARTLPDHTVVVRNGSIVEVGPSASTSIPSDAVRIEGEGRYLVPGLAEMDARLPAQDDPLRVVVQEEILFLFVANGVTTVRTTGGAPYQLALREEIADHEILGPTLYVGSPRLDANSAPDASSGEEQVRSHAQAGYDFLTIGSDLSLEAWNRAVSVAGDAGLSYGGEIPEPVDLRLALNDGVATVEGLRAYRVATRRDGRPGNESAEQALAETDPAKLRELARLTAEAGAYVIPAQHLSNHLAGWSQAFGGRVDADTLATLPELQYVPKTQRDGWVTEAWNLWSGPRFTPEFARTHAEWRRELLGELHAAGAPILVGTTSPALFNVPGFSVHRELSLMAEAGLTPYEVLESGTRNAARYVEEELGRPGEFGSIVPGHTADLVLLEQNPLDSVAALQVRAGVMVRGRWLPEEEIQERLEKIAERHKDYDQD